MIIRKSNNSDLNDLLEVERKAFPVDEGPEIVELIVGLLNDPTAKPVLSLLAIKENRAAGHILFTKARVDSNQQISAAILAPMAVVPDLQGQGIGGRLIAEGLLLLAELNCKLVFVLGHPDYYPRHGFKPAGSLGFKAPFPIPKEAFDAWMVQELSPGIIGSVKGKVLCANALNQPRYWLE